MMALRNPCPRQQARHVASRLALAAGVALGVGGCASPGPPRAPSLQVPAIVDDLAAERHGGVVTLRFSLPERATDGTPLRATTLTAHVCRAVDTGVCAPLATLPPQAVATDPGGRARTAATASWDDVLDSSLARGAPRLLTYRVELRNDFIARGVLGNPDRSGGYSEAAYAAAGVAPAAVESLTAQGSRLGVVLSWQPAAGEGGEIVLRREDVGSGASSHEKELTEKAGHSRHSANAAIVWLRASPIEAGGEIAAGAEQNLPQNRTLDTTAVPDRPYIYSAERRRNVVLGGRTLELHSAASGAVAFTLHEVYPPPAPTDLNATSFAAEPPQTGAQPGVLVDLIWQPVDDPKLAGYNVYREKLSADGHAEARQRLNQAPIQVPAFHDHLGADPSAERFRYSVTAVNEHGLESAPAAITVDVVKQ